MPKASGRNDGVPKPTDGSSDEDVKIVPKPWMVKRGITNNNN